MCNVHWNSLEIAILKISGTYSISTLFFPVKLLLILILLFKRPLVWLIQILEQNDYQKLSGNLSQTKTVWVLDPKKKLKDQNIVLNYQNIMNCDLKCEYTTYNSDLKCSPTHGFTNSQSFKFESLDQSERVTFVLMDKQAMFWLVKKLVR